jgi:uroporphyrin-III C-methyltransferase / precorrin-2 dehydrogenase / sirohydrochlorin ferrochelatase
MEQLPIFVNVAGSKVVLIGHGEAADAKRRLIERAGGMIVADCPMPVCQCSKIAFIALDNEKEAIATAKRLRAKGMLVNVVDRPDHCDFTTPAIVDRSPVLIAIGTGGASAGLAKALRQRLEAILPQSLGLLARTIFTAREMIRARFPDSAERRRAIDAAFMPGGPLDPMRDGADVRIKAWLESPTKVDEDQIIEIILSSNDPDDLTVRAARLLGQADHIFHEAGVASNVLNRARADAVRQPNNPPHALPSGLSIWLRLPTA